MAWLCATRDDANKDNMCTPTISSGINRPHHLRPSRIYPECRDYETPTTSSATQLRCLRRGRPRSTLGWNMLTITVGGFGCLGKSGHDDFVVDQLVFHFVGGTDVGSISTRGVVKQSLLQAVSVTMQGAMFRWVGGVELALKTRQLNQQSAAATVS